MRFTLAEAAAEEEEEDAGAEGEEVVVEHVRVADFLLQRLPLARRLARPLPVRPLGHPVLARPLGRVLAALRLLLGLRVVLQPVPGPPVALRPGRLPKVALDQVALCPGKVLPLHSVPPERVPM